MPSASITRKSATVSPGLETARARTHRQQTRRNARRWPPPTQIPWSTEPTTRPARCRTARHRRRSRGYHPPTSSRPATPMGAAFPEALPRFAESALRRTTPRARRQMSFCGTATRPTTTKNGTTRQSLVAIGACFCSVRTTTCACGPRAARQEQTCLRCRATRPPTGGFRTSTFAASAGCASISQAATRGRHEHPDVDVRSAQRK